MLFNILLISVLEEMEHELNYGELFCKLQVLSIFIFLLLPIYPKAVSTKRLSRGVNKHLFMQWLIHQDHMQLFEFRREVNRISLTFLISLKCFFGVQMPMCLVEAHENNRDLSSIFDECFLLGFHC